MFFFSSVGQVLTSCSADSSSAMRWIWTLHCLRTLSTYGKKKSYSSKMGNDYWDLGSTVIKFITLRLLQVPCLSRSFWPLVVLWCSVDKRGPHFVCFHAHVSFLIKHLQIWFLEEHYMFTVSIHVCLQALSVWYALKLQKYFVNYETLPDFPSAWGDEEMDEPLLHTSSCVSTSVVQQHGRGQLCNHHDGPGEMRSDDSQSFFWSPRE